MQRESVAKILIINDKNEALILRIGEYKAKPERSHSPDLPGGLVEVGESEMLAAVRETEEETGIILGKAPVELVYTMTRIEDAGSNSVTKLLYMTRLAITPEVKLSWEHESFEWVPVSEILKRYKFRPFYAEAIEYALNNGLV